jgi:hypothetical protein
MVLLASSLGLSPSKITWNWFTPGCPGARYTSALPPVDKATLEMGTGRLGSNDCPRAGDTT